MMKFQINHLLIKLRWFYLVSFIGLNFSLSLNAQNTPKIQWEKTFEFPDSAFKELNTKYKDKINLVCDLEYVEETADGGYIFSGTNSMLGSRGSFYRLIKLDKSGNILREKPLAGNFHNISKTLDNGYILAGKVAPSGITVSKVDSDFRISWSKTLKDSETIGWYSLKPTSDGGFILGGWSSSGITGDENQPFKGINNWVVKLNSAGEIIWEKTFGSDESKGGENIEQTIDGGFIFTLFVSGKDNTHQKGTNFNLIKLDNNGNKIWEKAINSEFNNNPKLLEAQDGGFYLAGYSSRKERVTTTITRDGPNVVKRDNFIIENSRIIKLDQIGNKVWEKKVGKINERLSSFIQTKDGGLAFIGFNKYPYYNSKPNLNYKTWIIKLNSKGNKKWSTTLNETKKKDFRNEVYDFRQTSDEGYIIGGKKFTGSGIRGNFWVVKISPE